MMEGHSSLESEVRAQDARFKEVCEKHGLLEQEVAHERARLAEELLRIRGSITQVENLAQ